MDSVVNEEVIGTEEMNTAPVKDITEEEITQNQNKINIMLDFSADFKCKRNFPTRKKVPKKKKSQAEQGISLNKPQENKEN